MESKELLACPFCGGTGKVCTADYVNDDLSPLPVVECQICEAWVPAHVWNKRAKLDGVEEPCAHSEANKLGCPECGVDFGSDPELVKALEMLILFTKPNKFNAAALANAYRALNATNSSSLEVSK